MDSQSAPNSGKLILSQEDGQPGSQRSSGTEGRPQSSRAKLFTLAKIFSAATSPAPASSGHRKSPSASDISSASMLLPTAPSRPSMHYEFSSGGGQASKNQDEEADLQGLAVLGGRRRSTSTPSQPTDEIQIGNALEDWKRSTKLSVTVTGQSGVGKSTLINTLLEASAPEEYEHQRRDLHLPSIEITGAEYSPHSHSSQTHSDYASSSYAFSAATSPDVSPPNSGKFASALYTSPPGSNRITPRQGQANGQGMQSMDPEESQVETLRADLRQIGVESSVHQYGRETGYSFEGNMPTQPSSYGKISPSSSRHDLPTHGRTYKGFSVDDILESSSKNAEAVYTPANTPYASMPTTPNSEFSEVQLDTRDHRRSTYKRATVYLFNGMAPSDEHHTPQVSVLPFASRTFFPDEVWTSTIDWSKEKHQTNDYQQLLENAATAGATDTDVRDPAGFGANSALVPLSQGGALPPVQLDDRKSYLLPQGSPVDVPQLVAVRYGRIPELIVSFPQEGELRLALWELHEITILGTKVFQSEQHRNLIEARYRKLLNLPDSQAIPLSDVESPQDLPLDRDVSALLGQNFRFVGLGKSLAQDRVFVREKLQEITSRYAYHMCKFLVRVPSSILDGNKELIEMSGPYIHGDFGTKLAVENTNLLLVAVDRMRGLSSDIVHLLQDSSLAQKLATKPELHKAIFVELAERYNLALPTAPQYADGNVPSFDDFKQNLLQQWRDALLLASSNVGQISGPNTVPALTSSDPTSMLEDPNAMMAKSSTTENNALFNPSTSVSMKSAINEATLEQLVSSTTVLEAKPTLFRSVHLQDDFPQELLPENDNAAATVREILAQTAIPQILSTIPNRLTAKVASTVKQLSHAVLLKNYDLLGRPGAIEGPDLLRQTSHATTRLETQLSSLGLSVNQFKTSLMTSARQIEPALALTASQSSATLLPQIQRKTVEEVAAIVKTVAVRPLIDSAAHAWRLAVAEVPRKAETLLASVQNLLSQSATIIDLHFPTGLVPNPEQTAKQMKLQQYIRTTNDDCIKHMVRFQDVLNQDVLPLAKDATLRTLQQHVLTNPTTGRLSHVQDLPALCPKTAAAIYSKFLGLFKTAISHLETLQADVVRALRAVTFAIKTHSKTSEGDAASPTKTTTMKNGASSMDVAQATPAEPIYVATMQRLAAQNALNWPGSVMSEEYKTNALYERAQLEMTDDMDSSRVEDSTLEEPYPNTAATEGPMQLSNTGMDHSSAFPHFEEQQEAQDQRYDGQEQRYEGYENLLAPWAEVKGVYAVLPQEESGVLFQAQLWEQVVSNAATSRLYFEALLKNSRISMGKSEADLFGDANAQFKVLAQQVYGSEATHAIVRLLICSEILSNPEYYGNLLYQTRGHVMEIQEYVHVMSQEGCRGDHLTLCAFTNFFGVDLLLFAPPFKQPLLLQSRRAMAQAHLASVAEHLSSTRLASTHFLSSANNKAFCIAMLPNDEFATLYPLSATNKRTHRHMDEEDNEMTDAEDAPLRATSAGPTTAQRKRARSLQLRRAFDRRKALETRGNLEDGGMNDADSVASRYDDYADGDDSSDDSVSDSEASQAEIVRAIRPRSSKKRKHGVSNSAQDSNHMHLSSGSDDHWTHHAIRGSSTFSTIPEEDVEGVDETISKRFKRATSSEAPPAATSAVVVNSASAMDITTSFEMEASAGSGMSSTSSKKSSVKMNKYDPILSERICSPPSLVDLCLRAVVDGLEAGLISSLSGQMPEEFLQRALLLLSERKRLTDANVARVLDPTMTSVSLYGPSSQISDITMNYVAMECNMLKELVLMQCSNITSAGLIAVVSRCPLLEHITIKGCAGIGNPAIQEIARKCPKLEFIDFSGCPQITDVALKELFLACPQLSTVILQHCNQITDDAFAHYIGRHIQVLDMLESDQVTNKTLSSIARHSGSKLRILKMSGRGISDIGMETLCKACPELRVIELTHAENITDASLIALWTHCRHLFTVNVAQCRAITAAAFGPKLPPPELLTEASNAMNVADETPAISLPSQLTKINLAMCLNINDDVLRHIAAQCPLLRHLTVSYCEEVSDLGVCAIAAGCPELRGLDITKCSKVSNIGVKAIVTSCPNMKRLIAANCVLLSDEALLAMASCCPRIRDLDLCSSAVTDVAVNAIGEACPNLKLIALSDCRLVTSFGLSSLANCHLLEIIRLSGCKAIDDISLLKLSIGCPNVMELDLAHCNTVNASVLSQALASWPRLVTLNLRGYTPTFRPDSPESGVLHLQHANLEDLTLSWCKFVDDAMIARMADGSPNLITLDLGWCPNVTANAFHRLAQKCRNLRTLNLRGCTKVGPLSVQYLSAASVVVYR